MSNFSVTAAFRHVALLRATPEVDTEFQKLDDYLRDVQFVGMQSIDGFSRIRPSLSSSLRSRWAKTVSRLCKLSDVLSVSITVDGDVESFVGQIVESYMLHFIAPVLLPWHARNCRAASVLVLNFIHQLKCECSASDLGIAGPLQAVHANVYPDFLALSSNHTPIEKMQKMKSIVNKIRENVNKCVNSKFPYDDVEMSTDDLVMILIYVIAQAYPNTSNLYDDVVYCTEYHMVPSSKNHLGYTLCHFQVAMEWLKIRSGAPSSTVLDAAIENEESFRDVPTRRCIDTLANNCKWLREEILEVSSQRGEQSRVIQEETDATKSEACCKTMVLVQLQQEEAEEHPRIEILSSVVDDVTRVKGAEDYFVGVSQTTHIYSWGLPDCGRLGRGVDCELDHRQRSEQPQINLNLMTALETNHEILVSVAVGGRHGAAVSDKGRLFLWGDNRQGQLGVVNNVEAQRQIPWLNTRQTYELQQLFACSLLHLASFDRIVVKSVACGDSHTLCLSENGVVYSWGRLCNGRLGQAGLYAVSLEDSTTVASPGRVLFDNFPEEINIFLQQSSSSSAQSPKFTPAASSVFVLQIAAGFAHSVAITSNGRVFSWGCGSYGRLGHGSHCDEWVPKQIQSLDDEFVIRSVSVGAFQTIMCTSENILFGCGRNDRNQLGVPSGPLASSRSSKLERMSVLTPIPIAFTGLKYNRTTIRAVRCGNNYSAALFEPPGGDCNLCVWGTLKKLDDDESNSYDKICNCSDSSDKAVSLLTPQFSFDLYSSKILTTVNRASARSSQSVSVTDFTFSGDNLVMLLVF